MSSDNQDRRGGGRVSHSIPLWVKALSSTFQPARSKDFNENGVRLEVPEPLSPGCRMVVHLRLEARKVLSLIGTVVWSEASEGGAEVGVRFHEGCRSSRQLLENWVHRKRLLAFV